MPAWVTLSFYAVAAICIAYLSTRLDWIGLVRKKDKTPMAIALLIINVVNALMLYHFAFEREHYLFSVFDPLPEIIYASAIGFVAIYGLMAFLGLMFYFPVADLVDQQNRELEGLMEISESARQRENVSQVFDRMFHAAMRDTDSDAGWLWFKVDKQDAVVKAKNINLSKVNAFRDALEPLIYKSPVKELLDVANLPAHPTLAALCNGFRSMVAVPIVSNQTELGMLCLFRNQTEGYNSHTTGMAKTYVNFALNAYENQQVLEETLRNEHVLEEYKLARQIQQRLIPATLQGQNGWEAVTYLEPSKEVGGDFYDSFVLDENRTAIIIGDVSGNGMPAALHMAEIKGIFLSLTSFNIEAKELIVRANNAITACFEKNRFVTLIYLVIDKKERKFTYIRAGHSPLLYYCSQRNEANYIKDEGLGLGILRGLAFEKHIHVYERSYEQNDTLVLFTDGIDEAIDLKTREPYGFERLRLSLLESVRHELPDKVMKGMLADMRRHVKDNKELDDMTMILLRFG
jgi:serine phosphatase RsbU (regulator of sigma subunit)